MSDPLITGGFQVAKSLFDPCLDPCLAPVRRHFSYVTSYDDHVGQLEHQAKKLDNERQTMQGLITQAENDGKKIYDNVEDWVKESEADSEEARRVLNDNETAIKTCFYGWLPNLKARYRLGRDARTMAKRIRELLDRIPSGKVYDDAPPGLVDGISSAGDRGNTVFKSRSSILKDIMSAFDDEKNKVIGIYGPGGVGKTTLLETVKEKLRNEKKSFHMMAKSKVSQNLDLKKSQDDIAYALGLNLNETSDEGRRDRLFQRLQKDPTKKVLIMLDDLWKELNLKDIGIPSGDESRGCQVLLTSRDKDVLRKTSASPIFHLEGLKEDEALILFEKTVGDRLQDNEELKAIAPAVVKKLAGLPLLIISVATFLKDSDASAWRNALIKIDATEMETIVTLSYNHLKSEDTKSLFLLCGLIGGTIQVETLLMLGLGLDLFGVYGRTMQGSRDRLYTMLDELRSACLLLGSGDDKKNVTIHDLYSEVVVSTPFKGKHSLRMNSNDGSWPKEKLEKCWAICLVDIVGDRLVEVMRGGCPALKILMLSQPMGVGLFPGHRHDEGDCCRLDFTYNKELRVLYLRFMHIPTLPPTIEILENLHSLYLDNCDVKDVAILGELKALQILSFTGSKISSLPKEIRKLTKLKLLNLSRCYSIQKIEPGVLGGLINLEELYTRGSSIQWMSKYGLLSESCNARLAELKSLTKLTTLEIEIRDPTVLLDDGDLPLGNLIRFWIETGYVYGRGFEGLTTMRLKLEGCHSIISKEWVQKTLQETQCLILDGLEEFKKSAHELCSRGFPKLKHLDIQKCSAIKHIVNSSNGAFPILESLFLESMINLEMICSGSGFFSKLKAISVKKCNRLEYLWSLSQMHSFAQLEKIEVDSCDLMRAIVIDDAGKDIVVANNWVEFPKVRCLKLAKLPKITSFCIEAGITSNGAPIQVWFPRLESLVMKGLFDLEEILYSQPSLEYNILKSIEISKSKSTSSILKSDWILKLPNLESLQIKSSPSAEAIFDLEELKVTEHVEILSRLTTLQLHKLPNLRRMCKVDAQLQGISMFRNLKELRVTNTGLAFLFPVSVAKCLREIRVIEVLDCEKMEALVVDEDGRDEGTNDILEFPLLKRLYVSRCPKIKTFSYFHGKKESVPITSDSQYAYSNSFFDCKVNLPNLKELHLESIRSFKSIWPHELPESSFHNLAELNLHNCSELLNVFFSTIMGRLHNLTTVVIEECRSLESVFECGSLDSKTTEQTGVLLQKLGGAPASDARRLSHVVKSDSQTGLALPNLEHVWVGTCSEIRYLFPYAVATTLEKLENLHIRYCKQMKEVVAKEEGVQSKANVMSFPSLKKLHIDDCPNLEAFIPNPKIVAGPTGEMAKKNDKSRQPFFNEMVNLPSLEDLRLVSVGSLKRIWPRELSRGSLDNLVDLSISFCSELLNVFPSSITRRLHNLTSVYINHCRSLESVFEFGSRYSNTEQTRVLLPNLEVVHIECCPSLESVFDCGSLTEHKNVLLPNLERVVVKFAEVLRHVVKSNSQTVLRFPSLKEVSVEYCFELRYLFPYGTATALEKLEELKIYKCKQMKEVVAKEEGGRSKAGVLSFPSLKDLHISDCPNSEAFIPNLTSVERPSSEMAKENDESRQSFFNEMVNLPSLEKLHLDSLGSFKSIWPRKLPEGSFDHLAEIKVLECSELLNIFLSTIIGRLHKLTSVIVRKCPSLESVFEFGSLDSNMEQKRVLLPDLNFICIERCPSLETVFDCGLLTEHKYVLLPKLVQMDVRLAGVLRHVVKSNSQTVLDFPSLNKISVESCSELRYLFPYGTATTLKKLKSLEIEDCQQMKEVVEEGARSKADVMSFPSLESLYISKCPNFGAFVPNPTSVKRPSGEIAKENDESQQPFFNEMVTFPTLSKVQIEGVRVKELWNNQIHDNSFCELRSLQLMGCDNLQRIAPSHVWKRLQCCLEILEVKSCRSIQIIYESDVTVAETGPLERLVLHDLENLRHIWRYDSLPNVKVPFPNLRDIDVLRCPRLRMLFESFMASFLGQIKWLRVESCDDMELIADHGECEGATCTTITFSDLDALKLKEMPKFRGYLPEKYHVEFPSLRVLIRVGCGKEPNQSNESDLVDWQLIQHPPEDISTEEYYWRLG